MRYACRLILIAFLAGFPAAASAAQQAFTIRDTEVFAGPSSQFPPVAVLRANASVGIVGCLRDWSWCDVIFANHRGWVYAADLVVPFQNERVVIIERGPQIGPALGLAVIAFSLHTYWDRHYRGQPWYHEREQWASRVRIEGDRGGAPPKGRAQAQRRQPEGDRPPRADAPGERPRSVPEAGRTAPGAGGARPRDEDAWRGDTARPPQRRPAPEAPSAAERPKGVPHAGKEPPGAGKKSDADGRAHDKKNKGGRNDGDKGKSGKKD